jgi:predicted TIM-barrel enzyme
MNYNIFYQQSHSLIGPQIGVVHIIAIPGECSHNRKINFISTGESLLGQEFKK